MLSCSRFYLPLLLFFSGYAFALPKYEAYGRIETKIHGSHKDDFIGKIIKFDSVKVPQEILELEFSSDKKYILKREDIEITVFKDDDNFNKIRIFTKYDLLLKRQKELSGYFYAICPVVESVEKDLSKIIDVRIVDGRKITEIEPKFEILSERIIDPGFFSIDNDPRNRHIILTNQPSESFMETKLEILCLKAATEIYNIIIEERNRANALEDFENE
ncbi:hypothetical protein SAMN05421749_104281 [Acinetobacter marinus]|uniref:Uncharacterized protein n=1 Tax=Acinetobacter marinus TaxID=281375 RepID=A0A1G6L480_9GAMM|nr:hypothetical protein [Acinetobacter marinus]SDC37496.1 hypothetical protein SAMN05421749_104281 [Acinetobacter marinus]